MTKKTEVYMDDKTGMPNDSRSDMAAKESPTLGESQFIDNEESGGMLSRLRDGLEPRIENNNYDRLRGKKREDVFIFSDPPSPINQLPCDTPNDSSFKEKGKKESFSSSNPKDPALTQPTSNIPPPPNDDRFTEDEISLTPPQASEPLLPSNTPNDDRQPDYEESHLLPCMRVPVRASEHIKRCILEEGLYALSRRPYIEHYMFILHLITERRLTHSRFRDETRFVCLGHKHLHRFISKGNTASFLQNLIRWEILEKDGQYWNGVDPKALGYRLTERYKNDETIEVAYTDTLLRKKVTQHKFLFDEGDATVDLAGYAESRRWLHALEIDLPSAESHIHEHWHHDPWKWRFRMEAAKMIANKTFWFWPGGRSRRVYHSLTNLPKDLRTFLSIHGQSLRQADIACSQPLFLHLLLKSTGLIPDHEVKDMEGLLATNTFYEAIAPPNVAREKVKERFYKEYLFAKKERTTKLTKIFCERFPTYAREISRLRQDERSTGVTLAAQLQSTEADVIFQAVYRFAIMTGNSVPILTIHDALVTIPESIETAKAVLESVFKERYDFIPILTIK